MSKVAVVYWSGTGNTEQMAHGVLDGAKRAGAEAELFRAAEFSGDRMDDFDAVAFGCPSMGNEELEEEEFEPMFAECLPRLKGKRIALFGSYGWGEGEWMVNWETVCRQAGADILGEPLICNEAPGDDEIELCRTLGGKLA